ncbi:MAG: SDR family oxidoreductase [Betaproteobacteria bacterium]|nr:MAG: SDR family oxidoreductase [Betaproteobacteria bacterium]
MSAEGRTVLITGAGRGIGFATARAFAEAGCRVLSLDKQFGDDVIGERVDYDLRDIAGIPTLIGQMGAIDTLVNNAAVLYCEPYDAIPEEHVTEIITVNLRAPVAMIEALAPQMRQRKSGRIVNVGSVSAFTGHPDLWYGATKAALLNITKSYAAELGSSGVFVNAVAPGPTLTAMYEQLPQSRKDAVMRSVHVGRPCNPEEVARVIVWLGTDSPDYVSGTTVDVNSGSYPR